MKENVTFNMLQKNNKLNRKQTPKTHMRWIYIFAFFLNASRFNCNFGWQSLIYYILLILLIKDHSCTSDMINNQCHVICSAQQYIFYISWVLRRFISAFTLSQTLIKNLSSLHLLIFLQILISFFKLTRHPHRAEITWASVFKTVFYTKL